MFSSDERYLYDEDFQYAFDNEYGLYFSDEPIYPVIQ